MEHVIKSRKIGKPVVFGASAHGYIMVKVGRLDWEMITKGGRICGDLDPMIAIPDAEDAAAEAQAFRRSCEAWYRAYVARLDRYDITAIQLEDEWIEAAHRRRNR